MSETSEKFHCAAHRHNCGGCQLLDLSYREQLEQKQALANRLLGRFVRPEPILQAENPLYYRCKVTRTFAQGRDGRLHWGLYAAGSHRVLEQTDCLLEDPLAAAAANAACKAAAQCRYEGFQEDRQTGLIRHVLVRRGIATGQIMVILVAVTDRLPSSRRFVELLLQNCPQVTTIVLNQNNRRTSAVLGDRFKTLYGPGHILDELCGCRFVISPGSFYQVNPMQTEKLYRTAMEFGQLENCRLALDAYCGTGTIGLVAAKNGAQAVMGVESNPNAVRDALTNAKKNHIQNIRFFAQDAGTFLAKLAQDAELPKPDLIFMDPPRAGSSEVFLQAVCKIAPRRVVYISCDPSTQARDLQVLCKKYYQAERIRPVDMFPFTRHLETVAVLSRR